MLSITSQYALRALSHLARLTDRAVLCRDLAASGTEPCTAHSTWIGIQAAYLKFLVSTPLSAIAGSPADSWASSQPGKWGAESHRPETSTHTGGSRQ